MHEQLVSPAQAQARRWKACKLDLTQSALSHTVRKLEDQLGTQIWLREGRSLRPTQAGEYLLAVANRLIPQLQHAEERLRQFAQGERGALRIGMECHPCYQWLLKIVSPYLAAWPAVDVDVKQKFQFGGIGALFGYEIDMLVTPDPLHKAGLLFEPVFDYEQVLVVGADHPLCGHDYIEPAALAGETLITYPVAIDRLDIYTQFLMPAGVTPPCGTSRSKPPTSCCKWSPVVVAWRPCRAGWWRNMQKNCRSAPYGWGAPALPMQIYLGIREADARTDYLCAFLELAHQHRTAA